MLEFMTLLTEKNSKSDALAGAKPLARHSSFAEHLLQWYDHHARQLPWRISPADGKLGILPEPYHVWLSEVMLQQTQVATVKDYYLRFLSLWPKVSDLALASNDDVMKAWAGLGYYSRARNLKKCAEIIASEYQARFPETLSQLKQLPGIGDYTAAAISAIAFQKPVAVLDGNIERIMTRQHRIALPLVQAKPVVNRLLQEILPHSRPGDFAQAMMDLGASLCSPRNPNCNSCPIASSCLAFKHGDQEAFPVKIAKTPKPRRKGSAFVIINEKGEILLQKRSDQGLLGGMSEVPGTAWTARLDGTTGLDGLPFPGNWKQSGIALHTFTHFHLELEVWHIEIDSANNDRLMRKFLASNKGWWTALENVGKEALPTVMKKAIAIALPNLVIKK